MSDDAKKWPRDLWLDAIFHDPDLKPGERLVAWVYSRYAGQKTQAWVITDRMKVHTGLKSRSAISIATKGLVDAGWLRLVTASRQHLAPVYRLTSPHDEALSDVRDSDVWNSDTWDSDVWNSTPDVRISTIRGLNSGHKALEVKALEIRDQSVREREPSGARSASCRRCAGRGVVAVGTGCLDRCPECSPSIVEVSA